MADLLSLGAPDLRQHHAPYGGSGTERFTARYILRARVPSGTDDECYIARLTSGTSAFEKPVFVRRWHGTVDREPYRRRGMVSLRGVEQIFELGLVDGWTFVASDWVEGASLAELPRISWAAAAVIAADTLARVDELLAKGILHGDLSPQRIRIALWGHVTLCWGRHARTTATLGEITSEVLGWIFALAAVDEAERALVRRLLAHHELSVLCDALCERHSELDPFLPLALVHGADFDDLKHHVDREAVHAFWQQVIHAAHNITTIAPSTEATSRPSRNRP